MSRLAFRSLLTLPRIPTMDDLIAVASAMLSAGERMDWEGVSFSHRWVCDGVVYRVNRRARPSIGDGVIDYYFELREPPRRGLRDLAFRSKPSITVPDQRTMRYMTVEEAFANGNHEEQWNR